jgi:hypothetical protein
MNDESSVFENTEKPSLSTGDTLERENAPKRVACGNQTDEKTFTGADEDTACILADTNADSDFDSEKPASQTQKSELEQLRSELKHLREELALRTSLTNQENRATREYDEFCSLYPDVPVSSLSPAVWQDVEKGAPLAAAYALAEKRKAVSLRKAMESNTNNRTRSAGAVKNAETVEFSPAEVRAMTSQEVRANLSKIMRSMQKWH